MSQYSVVGHGLPRVDSLAKATGQAQYTGDVSLPGMLWAKILRSPLPHARILHIDTSRAGRLPGVRGIITGHDVGPIRYAFVDTPRYPADEYPLAIDTVRYIGDEVAAVAAVDEETAEEALELIRVEYEPLPAVFDPEAAMQPDAPVLHPAAGPGTSIWEDWLGEKKGRGAGGQGRQGAQASYNNLSAETHIAYGDVAAGFAAAEYVREDRFHTQATAHAALEPHVAVAHFDPSGKLDIWLSSMAIFYKRQLLARTLGLPDSAVRVRKAYVGGAFGGKIDMFPYEFCAAYLSCKTGKPVKLELSREEVFSTTRQRHPMIIDLKTGVKRDGTITAQQFRIVVDNGAYRGTGAVVIFLVHAFNAPLYRVENVRYDAYAVYTNNPIRGAQRAHGAPQIRFAVDSQLDMIAEELGLDPVEVMLRNARQTGDVLPNGDVLRSCGLSEAIEQAVEVSGWQSKRGRPGSIRWDGQPKSGPTPPEEDSFGFPMIGVQESPTCWGETLDTPNKLGTPTRSPRKLPENPEATGVALRSHPNRRRGVGISACAMFNGSPYYPFASAAVVQLHDDGGASLFTGTVEMGQGSETTLAQIVAEELGLRLDQIRVISGDTEITPIDMGSFLSGGAFVTGRAARAAAVDARAQLFKVAGRMLDASPECLVLRGGQVSHATNPALSVPVTAVIRQSISQDGEPIIGRGSSQIVEGVDRYPSLAKGKGRFTDAYGFSVSVAEVEVDTDTGAVRLARATTFHDCGFPLNPMIVEGQIDGNISMGQGQALTEEIQIMEGQVMNASFLTYGLPTSLQTPEVQRGEILTRDPGGPFGAKEVGEGAISGVLAAVANAVHDAVGVRVTHLPITQAKILRALEEKRKLQTQ